MNLGGKRRIRNLHISWCLKIIFWWCYWMCLSFKEFHYTERSMSLDLGKLNKFVQLWKAKDNLQCGFSRDTSEYKIMCFFSSSFSRVSVWEIRVHSAKQKQLLKVVLGGNRSMPHYLLEWNQTKNCHGSFSAGSCVAYCSTSGSAFQTGYKFEGRDFFSVCSERAFKENISKKWLQGKHSFQWIVPAAATYCHYWSEKRWNKSFVRDVKSPSRYCSSREWSSLLWLGRSLQEWIAVVY